MRPPIARLTAIRLLAALCVVLSHAFSVARGGIEAEPFYASTGLSLGHMAVLAFFTVSGFVIAGSLERDPRVLPFLARRACRVWPAMIAAVALTAFVLGPILTQLSPASYWASPELPRYLLGTLTLLDPLRPLPGLFESLPEAGVVNVPLWTLKVRGGRLPRPGRRSPRARTPPRTAPPLAAGSGPREPARLFPSWQGSHHRFPNWWFQPC